MKQKQMEKLILDNNEVNLKIIKEQNLTIQNPKMNEEDLKKCSYVIVRHGFSE